MVIFDERIKHSAFHSINLQYKETSTYRLLANLYNLVIVSEWSWIQTNFSPHERVTFSIHSLNPTGSLCLYRCHMTCISMPALNICPFNTSCLRPHHIHSIYSTTARLYGAPLILFVHVPPKVIGPREGHGGDQHIA